MDEKPKEERKEEQKEESKNEEQRDEEKKETSTTSSSSSASGKVNPVAVLSYLSILVLIPWFMAKNDKFVMFHVRQGLTLFIAEIITWAIGFIPVIGWTIAVIGWIVWASFSVLGIINVLQGKEKELPFIGQYAKNWKI